MTNGKIDFNDMMTYTEVETPDIMSSDPTDESEGPSSTLRNRKCCAKCRNPFFSLTKRVGHNINLINDSSSSFDAFEYDEFGSSVELNLEDYRGPILSQNTTFSEEIPTRSVNKTKQTSTSKEIKLTKNKNIKKERVDTSNMLLLDFGSLNI